MHNKNFRRLALATLGVISSLAASPVFAAPAHQESFKTPEQAVAALVSANRDNDVPRLLHILGPDSQKLLSSGDPVADKEGREKFVAAFDSVHRLDNQGKDREILIIGQEEWPLPIPLVRSHGKWQFDTSAAKEEILNRRIGRNELNVIELCRTYVEAQEEFAASHNNEYAQRFVSSEGKHDGLYWPAEADEQESPFGPLIAKAEAEGYTPEGKKNLEPYHGYYYRILTQQGPSARSGAHNYIVDGHMTGGFALLAYPATYGDSGIMSFIINQNGIVYEKNFGPDTRTLVSGIKAFDPDDSWNVVSTGAVIEKAEDAHAGLVK